MTSDYQSIRHANKKRYGTDIGRIGQKLFSDQYSDRTHFIFELLQNAEDALARRDQWQENQTVSFQLTKTQLRVSHFGQPFTEADVQGICAIAESTKGSTAIGHFGIGFKSVYAITNRPEVHSGTEDFAIENFVWPVGIQHASQLCDETLFILPFKQDNFAFDDISRGLQRLGATALLFLRQIEEIRWSIEGGPSGTYLRDSKDMDAGVRCVTIIGQQYNAGEVDDEWLIFSQAVKNQDGCPAGYVEIAFSRDKSRDGRIRKISSSPLVVFFPTMVETYLGFLLQGPYRTTPTREQIHESDPWNQHLVDETGTLLLESLRWLRDNNFLDTTVMQCLPIDQSKFHKESKFESLFHVTKKALSSERLLPQFGGGHATASGARLGGTKELRDLFNASQLAAILGENGEVFWLSDDITRESTPKLWYYMTQVLNIAVLTPQEIIKKLNKTFLETQSDSWIVALYKLLNSQPKSQLEKLPLIRLEDGTHVQPRIHGELQAFLPTATVTGFPTVRASVCTTDTAREFLRSLGLAEPDPVDDVIRNILPKYRGEIVVSDPEYENDIHRIMRAYGTDSKAQQVKLIAALRDSAFVMAIDAGDGTKGAKKPDEVYLATKHLKELFAGVKGVLITDDTYVCLRDKHVHELLEACGVTHYLQPIYFKANFSYEKRLDMRRSAGCKDSTGEDPIYDQTLRGLDQLLSIIPSLDTEARAKRSGLLWEALGDIEQQPPYKSIFSGTYRWRYHSPRFTHFNAAFVEKLNSETWVPDGSGELQCPKSVLFDTLGWKPNPYLQSKISFKPPLIETLAREAGIEPGILDFLKKHGVTSVLELEARLRPPEESKLSDSNSTSQTKKEEAKPKNAHGTSLSVRNTEESKLDSSENGDSESGTTARVGGTRSGHREIADTDKWSQRTVAEEDSGPKEGKRIFISYVGVHPDNKEPGPDGSDQQARMALEAKAIKFILSREPAWRGTSIHNPGYDLYLTDESDNVIQWCEVKAMTDSLNHHPVGLSHTQFDCAREHGEAYWLYVVEHVGTEKARIIRIQDPAGKARTFTFDYGWIDVATPDSITK